ncbi:MAG: DUF4349 domain-containing protein [Eubacteriales bacterium]|nr:DUF4349 domain-containing protein [Eubacteriales bacterium]
MNKRSRFLIAAVLIAISLFSMLAGCSKKAEYDSMPPQQKEGANEAGEYDNDTTGIEQSDSSNYGSTSTGLSDILAQRKVIFKANVTVEVEKMSEALGKIDTIIDGIGFRSSSKLSQDEVRVNGDKVVLKNGIVVIRVAREEFDNVMSNLNGLGNVIDSETFSDDISDKYFDTESRLKILRIEEDRLLKYLEDINDPDTIFKYEGRLTTVRTEIEALTGSLRKWDDLVELSTITINIREVLPEKDKDKETGEGYFERMWNGFVKSINGVVKFLGELLIVIVKALPFLAVIGIIGGVVLLAMGWPKRRFKKGGKSDKNVSN